MMEIMSFRDECISSTFVIPNVPCVLAGCLLTARGMRSRTSQCRVIAH